MNPEKPTPEPKTANTSAANSANKRVALICAGVAGGMVGLAYAAVPLYDAFCRVTGFGGTTQTAVVAPAEILDQEITVRFDANVSRGLAWEFEPVQTAQTMRLGEQMLAFYKVTNHSDKPVTGTATYNVTPQKVGYYFAKIECFCFTEQTLQPGQTMTMPVSYFVDPRLVEDGNAAEVKEITLSYTFFPVEKTAALQTN